MTPDRSRVGREAANLVCGVVILAAGASSRMGRPKLLLPWGETSVLGHLIGQWQVLQARQITVVHAEGDDALDAELDRLAFVAVHRIANPTAERGMFSSIQCAARWRGWNRELTHWAIVLGVSALLPIRSRFVSPPETGAPGIRSSCRRQFLAAWRILPGPTSNNFSGTRRLTWRCAHRMMRHSTLTWTRPRITKRHCESF